MIRTRQKQRQSDIMIMKYKIVCQSAHEHVCVCGGGSVCLHASVHVWLYVSMVVRVYYGRESIFTTMGSVKIPPFDPALI